MEQNRQGKSDSPKEINDIRIGMNSRVRNVIRYCNFVLNEKKLGELRFSAVGGAIGKLVDAVEVLKIVNPGLYQVNKIATVSYQTVDTQGKLVNQRLYPKLEVVLSLAPSKDKSEGSQDKLDEAERTKLFELLNARQTRPEGYEGHEGHEGAEGEERPRGRGRGRGRGGFSRGGRGFPRGRGGFRGQRGAPRGGRGFSRGAPRGGFRGERGAPRGGFRGERGAPRGGFRGERGAPRGRGQRQEY
jgi:hypothetical protein